MNQKRLNDSKCSKLDRKNGSFGCDLYGILKPQSMIEKVSRIFLKIVSNVIQFILLAILLIAAKENWREKNLAEQSEVKSLINDLKKNIEMMKFNNSISTNHNRFRRGAHQLQKYQQSQNAYIKDNHKK